MDDSSGSHGASGSHGEERTEWGTAPKTGVELEREEAAAAEEDMSFDGVQNSKRPSAAELLEWEEGGGGEAKVRELYEELENATEVWKHHPGGNPGAN